MHNCLDINGKGKSTNKWEEVYGMLSNEFTTEELNQLLTIGSIIPSKTSCTSGTYRDASRLSRLSWLPMVKPASSASARCNQISRSLLCIRKQSSLTYRSEGNTPFLIAVCLGVFFGFSISESNPFYPFKSIHQVFVTRGGRWNYAIVQDIILNFSISHFFSSAILYEHFHTSFSPLYYQPFVMNPKTLFVIHFSH